MLNRNASPSLLPSKASLFKKLLALSTIWAVLECSDRAHAVSYVWDPAVTGAIQYGDGVWSSSAANWTTDSGVSNAAWVNSASNSAVFTSATGTVPALVTLTLGEDILLNSINMGSNYGANVLVTGSNSLTFAGSNATISANNATRSLTLDAVISGSVSINKTNAGTVIFAKNNNYTGPTNLTGNASANGGVLQVGNGGATGSLGAGVVNILQSTSQTGASTLRYNRSDAVTVSNNINISDAANGGIIEQSGAGKVSFSGTHTLTGSVNYRINDTVSGAGADAEVIGRVTGAGNVTKSGAGTLLLSGNNDYTGNTVVSAGTLLVRGTLSTSTQVSVSGGSALGVGNAAGGSYTALTVRGLALTQGPNGSGSTQSTVVLGLGQASNDKILASTGLTLTGSGAIHLVLTDNTLLNDISSLSGTYVLFDWTGGSGFTSINQIDLTGSSTSIQSSNLQILGNTLVYNAIPEPSAILLVSLGLVFTMRRFILRRAKSVFIMLTFASLAHGTVSANADDRVSIADRFVSKEKVPLDGRSLDQNKVSWQASANLTLGEGKDEGCILVNNGSAFVAGLPLPPQARSIQINAKVSPVAMGENAKNWIAIGIGHPTVAPPQTTWPGGLFLLLNSEGEYEVLTTSSEDMKQSLKHGRVPGDWGQGWNELSLEYDINKKTLSVSINEIPLVTGLSIPAGPLTTDDLLAGFSGYSQRSDAPAVSDFRLTAK